LVDREPIKHDPIVVAFFTTLRHDAAAIASVIDFDMEIPFLPKKEFACTV
jgi:hypothetical protein